MSNMNEVRVLVRRRLAAAAEEICGVLDLTLGGLEEEVRRQRRLLDSVLNPQIRLQRGDVRQLLVSEEEQQDWSSSLDQEDPDPPHIKEEQEELWSSQEGEQLQGLEEADFTKFTFTPVPVKSEDDDDDEEKPQSSQLHQSQAEENREAEPPASSSAEHMETGADGEDCGGPGPDRNSGPHGHLEPGSDDEPSGSNEPEIENSVGDWAEMKKSFSCSDCGRRFDRKGNLQTHLRTHTGEKPFSCSVCQKSFGCRSTLTKHMLTHTGEKPFGCLFCGKKFHIKGTLVRHMETHRTREKGFSCSVCVKKFYDKSTLVRHMRTHITTEKTPSCSFCGKNFYDKSSLEKHKATHTPREKTFSCSECEKKFYLEAHLKGHMRIHTKGEKPFSCPICAKTFKLKDYLKKHMKVHTGEKPFSCRVCDQRFTWYPQLKAHQCVQRPAEEESLPPVSGGGWERYLWTLSVTADICKENSITACKIRFPPCRNGLSPGSTSELSSVSSSSDCSLPHLCRLNPDSQIDHAAKSFPALRAAEGFLSSVTHHVAQQGPLAAKCFPTTRLLDVDSGESAPEKRGAVCEGKLSVCGCVNMAKVQELRALVEQRLAAAAAEILGLFERTVAEYERELSRSEQENQRHRKLLDAVFRPQVLGPRADVRQLLVSEEEQQDWSSSLDQEDPDPPHIKEEQEELWSSQEGEQLQGLEEADFTKFTFTPVPVKSEDDDDDEEKPQSSQLHQSQAEENREAEPPASSSAEHMETGADGEDCGGPGPDRNSGPHVEPGPDDRAEDSSETDVSDDDDKEETREPQSGLNSVKKKKVSVGEISCNNSERPISCSEFGHSGNLSKHTGQKRFSCSECEKTFSRKTILKVHMRTHTGEKPFGCLVCGQRFTYRVSLKQHMTHHTREIQLACAGESSQLVEVETFGCCECGKTFGRKDTLQEHMRTHTGEKPFSCSECGKTFSRKTNLKAHMRIHTGEKRFGCSVCHKRFTWHHQLKNHQCVGHSADCGGSRPARDHMTPTDFQ
ncbi:gastrula zinc finger protein xFG20-1-like [Trachinotus anak]|uniref:gastrula zinc finger protein xFG20-1-like n=1 Tax=Trachinotus anak TaxID=443729 RepID=UPI0039F226CC